jgi:hypothetical protein
MTAGSIDLSNLSSPVGALKSRLKMSSVPMVARMSSTAAAAAAAAKVWKHSVGSTNIKVSEMLPNGPQNTHFNAGTGCNCHANA